MAIFVIWGMWSGVTLGRVYYDDRYQAEPFRSAVEYLKEQAQTQHNTGVLFTDPSAYRRVYPFLHTELGLRVAKTGCPHWSDDLQGWTTAHPTFWFWREDDTDPDLEGWLDEWPANHGFERLDTKTFKIEK